MLGERLVKVWASNIYFRLLLRILFIYGENRFSLEQVDQDFFGAEVYQEIKELLKCIKPGINQPINLYNLKYIFYPSDSIPSLKELMIDKLIRQALAGEHVALDELPEEIMEQILKNLTLYSYPKNKEFLNAETVAGYLKLLIQAAKLEPQNDQEIQTVLQLGVVFGGKYELLGLLDKITNSVELKRRLLAKDADGCILLDIAWQCKNAETLAVLTDVYATMPKLNAHLMFERVNFFYVSDNLSDFDNQHIDYFSKQKLVDKQALIVELKKKRRNSILKWIAIMFGGSILTLGCSWCIPFYFAGGIFFGMTSVFATLLGGGMTVEGVMYFYQQLNKTNELLKILQNDNNGDIEAGRAINTKQQTYDQLLKQLDYSPRLQLEIKKIENKVDAIIQVMSPATNVATEQVTQRRNGKVEENDLSFRY